MRTSPEQEPVAWKVVDKTTGEFMFSRVKPMKRTYIYDDVIPLYTSPPKREPLRLQQEPVGYLYKQMDCHGEWGTIFKVDKPYISYHDIKDIVPVYTAPQKSYPLSDETIAELWGEAYSGTTKMVSDLLDYELQSNNK